MTRADLLALAERVEREEPSQDLDYAVMVAAKSKPLYPLGTAAYGSLIPPRYTSSLDAAASLVPPGWSVLAAWSEVGAIVNLSRKPLGTIDGQEWMQAVTAKTPAAALTAAALRARAQEVAE